MKKVLLLLSLFLVASVYAQEDIEVINIENAAVQAYMQDSTYNYDDNYDVSVVNNYANRQLYGSDIGYPAGKEVSWTPTAKPADIEEIRIIVDNSPYFDFPTTFYTLTTKATSYTIRNLFPNRKYYYKVEEVLKDSTVTVLAKGKFRTVGQVRMIRVHGANNVRDIGGWQTSFGVPVRYGLLYRSANLDKVTDTGRHDFVDNLGVEAELDLRGNDRGDPKLTHSPLGDEVSYIQIINDAYTLPRHRHIYIQDIRWILEQLREGVSVDWHCAAGCDRAGTVSFIIEGLLGVSEADLCRDYELSAFAGYKRTRSNWFRRMMPHIKEYGDETDLAQCFYNYLKEGGMTDKELRELRYLMLGKTK